MSFYGILDLHATMISITKQTTRTEFLFTQTFKDSLIRNYFLLKRYSSKYHKTSYKDFLSKIKKFVRQDKQNKKQSDELKIQSKIILAQLPTLGFTNYGQQNFVKKNSTNSYRDINSRYMNNENYVSNIDRVSSLNNINMDAKFLSKYDERTSYIKKSKYKQPFDQTKSPKIISFGQNQLVSKQNMQQKLAAKHKFFLLRLSHRKYLSPPKQNIENSLNEFSLQINHKTTRKFDSSIEKKKLYFPIFSYF